MFDVSPLGLIETKYFAVTLKQSLKFAERSFRGKIATIQQNIIE